MNKPFNSLGSHRSSSLIALMICGLLIPLLAACGAASGGTAATATPPPSAPTSTVSPEVAEALIALSGDMSGIQTVASLQS